MTEQELTHNRREFGLIGASEAFNEEVIKQMKAGVPKIEHKYPTKNAVTGDEAETVFYLNKAGDSNAYFLNKWDVKAKKFGTEEPVERSFYNNDLKRVGSILKDPNKLVTTFTHSRSVNYLCGRPVLNTYRNKNGRIKKVWDQAYPTEKQQNGKLKERSFHEEYGFNLRAIGKEYQGAIKSLSNPDYANRLYQSLERGNLEKTAFVEKNGKDNPYYVTPNIAVGYLDVYTEASKDAKPLTPEQQAEKGFISQEFALKVRERMNQMEKQKEIHKQDKASDAVSAPKQNNVRGEKEKVVKEKKPKTSEKIREGTHRPKRSLKHKPS